MSSIVLFLFGAPIARSLKVPFHWARKAGKLPGVTISQEYALEYNSSSTIEMQKVQIVGGKAQATLPLGQKVAVVDDILATGGTAQATSLLVKALGGEVIGYYFLIEIEGLSEVDLDASVYSVLSAKNGVLQ